MSATELAQEGRERAREVAEEATVDIDLSQRHRQDDSVEELQAELELTADGFRVSDFKCQACGLAHGHDTDKHRASDAFELSHEEAAELEMNPNGHCALHELAERADEFGVDEAKVRQTARSAPVPESVKKKFH